MTPLTLNRDALRCEQLATEARRLRAQADDWRAPDPDAGFWGDDPEADRLDAQADALDQEIAAIEAQHAGDDDAVNRLDELMAAVERALAGDRGPAQEGAQEFAPDLAWISTTAVARLARRQTASVFRLTTKAVAAGVAREIGGGAKRVHVRWNPDTAVNWIEDTLRNR